MTGCLAGKIAIITGGASGIGLAAVEVFAAEGARIVAADIQDEKGAALERRFGGQVRYAHCDVMNEQDILAAIGLSSDTFGGLDILYNNAGTAGPGEGPLEITAEKWNRVFALYVTGPMLAMKYAAPLMIARGGGSIINTASIAALQVGYGPYAYSAAKAAVIQMSRHAVAELSPKGIRVNTICPGLIASGIFGRSLRLSREASDSLAAKVAGNAADFQPLHHAGLPQDIARVALFLASDAGAFVNGVCIPVDGGVTIGPRHAWDPATPDPIAMAMGGGFAPRAG